MARLSFDVHNSEERAGASGLVAEVTAAVLSDMPAQRSLDNPDELRELVQRVVGKAVTAFASEQDDRSEARQAIAQALLRGRPVENLASAARVQIGDAHVMLMIEYGCGLTDKACALISGLVERQAALSAPSGAQLFLLVPILRPADAGSVIARVREQDMDMLIAASVVSTRDRVPQAVSELRTVMRAIKAFDREPAIYRIEDVPIEAALIRSPDLAELLADRLTVLSRSGAPLLETLFLYLDHGKDRVSAARQLHVHPNTLDYRLRRIRELTGLSPWRPRDIQTLGAAVIALRLLSGSGRSLAV